MTPGGKLAVLFAGLGGLATTLIAKCLLAQKGAGKFAAFASLPLADSEMALATSFREVLQLTPVQDLVFGGWDVFLEDASVGVEFAEILDPAEVEPVAAALRTMKPMRAVFYRDYPVGVFGTFNKRLPTKAGMAEAVEDDIRLFREAHGAQRAVAIWCGSPERLPEPAAHDTIATFAHGLEVNDLSITNSQIYAWACVRSGTPFISVEPNGCVLFPAIRQLALERRVPLAGEGFPSCPPPVDPDLATEADRLARREAILRTVPLLLDTILLVDRAHRSGWAGLQDWLGFYFTGPGAELPRRKQRLLEALPRLTGNQPEPLA